MSDHHDDDFDPFENQIFDYDLGESRGVDPQIVHAGPMARGARCKECALYGCGRGPVDPLAKAPSHPRLLVIGETPGRQEVEEGVPFWGAPRDIINSGLESGGVEPDEVAYTYACLCQPSLPLRDFQAKLSKGTLFDDQRRPIRGLDPLAACAPRLATDIKAVSTKVLLPVGGAALEAVAEIHGMKYGSSKKLKGVATCATIRNQHGAPIEVDDRIIVATLHPAFGLFGNRTYLQVIREDVAKAARIAVRGYVDWQLPPTLVIPRDEDPGPVAKWLAVINWMHDNCPKVTIDIETDGIDVNKCRIRCIGIHAFCEGENPFTHSTELAAVLPIRRRNGIPFYNEHDTSLLRDACRRLFDKAVIIGHNVVNFDLTVLHRNGYVTDRNKRACCTMIAHHCSEEADLPHSLSFVMRRLFEAPMHKHDVDHKGSEEGDDDYTLHTYCASDIVVTGRAWPHLEQWVHRAGNVKAFVVDSKLGPIASQAGYDIGLFVDERLRGERSAQFNHLCRLFRDDFMQRAAKIQKRYGSAEFDVSPSSPVAVGRLLWGALKLRPMLTTKNIAWEEGEDASTSTPALLSLLDSKQIDDPAVLDLIESLIRFRSCDKVRSTYLDNLRVTYDPAFAYLGSVDPVRLEKEILPRRPALSRLFITWKLQTVPSGRWASSPNAQNIPARAFAPVLLDDAGRILTDHLGRPLRADALNLRELFVAPPGHKIIGSDLQQIENRIYAVDANDQFLIRAYTEPGPDGQPIDVHTLNAATLFIPLKNPSWSDLLAFYMELKKLKKSDPSRYKFIRTVAKLDAYAAVYGVGREKFLVMFQTHRDKATGERTFPEMRKKDSDHFYDTWHRMHPETKPWQAGVRAKNHILGYVDEPIHGRRRYFRDGASKPDAVTNHTIQAHVGGKMNQATLDLVDDIPFKAWSEYTGMCLQVHDYLGFYAPDEHAEYVKARVEERLYSEYGPLPLPGDVALITDNWAQQG